MKLTNIILTIAIMTLVLGGCGGGKYSSDADVLAGGIPAQMVDEGGQLQIPEDLAELGGFEEEKGLSSEMECKACSRFLKRYELDVKKEEFAAYGSLDTNVLLNSPVFMFFMGPAFMDLLSKMEGPLPVNDAKKDLLSICAGFKFSIKSSEVQSTTNIRPDSEIDSAETTGVLTNNIAGTGADNPTTALQTSPQTTTDDSANTDTEIVSDTRITTAESSTDSLNFVQGLLVIDANLASDFDFVEFLKSATDSDNVVEHPSGYLLTVHDDVPIIAARSGGRIFIGDQDSISYAMAAAELVIDTCPFKGMGLPIAPIKVMAEGKIPDEIRDSPKAEMLLEQVPTGAVVLGAADISDHVFILVKALQDLQDIGIEEVASVHLKLNLTNLKLDEIMKAAEDKVDAGQTFIRGMNESVNLTNPQNQYDINTVNPDALVETIKMR